MLRSFASWAPAEEHLYRIGDYWCKHSSVSHGHVLLSALWCQSQFRDLLEHVSTSKEFVVLKHASHPTTHTQLNIPRVQCKWHCPQCPGWAPHAWGRHALARHVRAHRGCTRPVRAHHDWARRGWARRGWARRGWAPHKASWSWWNGFVSNPIVGTQLHSECPRMWSHVGSELGWPGWSSCLQGSAKSVLFGNLTHTFRQYLVPSGKTKSYWSHGPVELVDLPIKHIKKWWFSMIFPNFP